METGFLDKIGSQRREALSGTSLISPARPPSLAFHRPSWSPRGSATDFEHDRYSAGSDGRQALLEARSKKENPELIKAIVTSKMFTEFECAFSEATGLPVSLRPVGSFQPQWHDGRSEAPVCALMARADRTCEACLKARAGIAEAASEGPHTSVCFAGLCETAVPVRVGNRLIGHLWTGQVFQQRPARRQFDRAYQLLTSRGGYLDRDVLQEAYSKTRVVSAEHYAAAVKLLGIFAEYVATLSNELLIQLNNAEPPMIAKAKDFIREHYAEDLSLREVAKHSNMNRYYFCKVFKRATRLTFTQFLSRVRVESCTRLLTNPQLRISEVAYAVGFQSLTSFNRVFQRVLGQSPTAYRLMMQNRRKPA